METTKREKKNYDWLLGFIRGISVLIGEEFILPPSVNKKSEVVLINNEYTGYAVEVDGEILIDDTVFNVEN